MASASEMAVAAEVAPTVGAPARWQPSAAGRVARWVVLAAIAALVLAIPYLVPDPQINVVSRAAVYGVVALSMNILMGYTGQVSLGHQAFVGVGAFAAGITLTDGVMPWPVAALVAVGSGGVAAVLLGAIALRVQGLYLALVTIAYALFTQRVLFNLEFVTGGGAGMPAPRPAFASGDIAYAYLCFALLGLIALFDWRLTASKAGRAIQGLRDSERVAASWGINITAYKLLAFVASGSIAGLAGAMFGSIEQIVSPVTFELPLGLTFVLMTVVGGLGSRVGVVIGGVVFAVLPTVLDSMHTAFAWWPFTAVWEPLLGAMLLLITLIQFPGGIAQQLSPLLRWLSFGRLRGEGHGHGAVATGEARS